MSEPLAIALIGAGGRMGLAIARTAADREDVRVVAAVEHGAHPRLGRDLGELAGAGPLDIALGDDLDGAARSARVIVDLSLPSATAQVIAAAVRHGTALVCGTTGLEPDALAALDDAAGTIPVLYTTNLSPGIALLGQLIAAAIPALGAGYDIEIIETHHRDKIDAPSGTALTLAHTAATAAGLDPEVALRHGREGRTGARPPDEIGVHAVRGGGVFGEHRVVLAGRHEQLVLTHRAASRALFAEGALRAAAFLAGKEPGRYTMLDVLGRQ
jgi:4-hydroxy-tetrahydrodipicolinate reductase